MLPSHLRGRMFELEEVRTWERNPQFYADILASSLAGQALFTHAPAAERARRVLSKLRQTPRLIQAARDNIKEPPGIFVKVGIETMRGALKFIDDDLPRAFADVDDLHLLGDLADAQTEASQARRRVHRVPRNRGRAARRAPRSGSAATSSSRSCGSRKGIAMPVDRLLAIADARAARRRRRRSSRWPARMNGGDPLEAWAQTKAEHPAPGELVAVGREQLDELDDVPRAPVDRSRCPPASRSPSRRRRSSIAGRSPACGRRARSRRKPTRAYYYLTDVDPSWPAERQDEHLRDYNYPDALVDLDSRGLSRATSCTTSTCGGSNRRRASRSCSRRRRSSKAGRTTASR